MLVVEDDPSVLAAKAGARGLRPECESRGAEHEQGHGQDEARDEMTRVSVHAYLQVDAVARCSGRSKPCPTVPRR